VDGQARSRVVSKRLAQGFKFTRLCSWHRTNTDEPVIAWVLNRTHFVLVTGWDAGDSDTLYVNDPYFQRDTYSYAKDVVGWRFFTMEPVV
jgi:hypothetical protein